MQREEYEYQGSIINGATKDLPRQTGCECIKPTNGSVAIPSIDVKDQDNLKASDSGMDPQFSHLYARASTWRKREINRATPDRHCSELETNSPETYFRG